MFEFHPTESGLRIQIKVPRFEAINVESFKQQFKQYQNCDLRHVDIDFAEVDFIDSSGIGALLSIQKSRTPDSDPIVLRNAKPAVISVIELLRLHRVFQLKRD